MVTTLEAMRGLTTTYRLFPQQLHRSSAMDYINHELYPCSLTMGSPAQGQHSLGVSIHAKTRVTYLFGDWNPPYSPPADCPFTLVLPMGVDNVHQPKRACGYPVPEGGQLTAPNRVSTFVFPSKGSIELHVSLRYETFGHRALLILHPMNARYLLNRPGAAMVKTFYLFQTQNTCISSCFFFCTRLA